MSEETRIRGWLEALGCRNIRVSGSGNLVCSCPFHSDTHASFSISVDTGQFICFSESCGEKGGPVSFLMKAFGYSADKAVTAVKDLSLREGAGSGVPDTLQGILSYLDGIKTTDTPLNEAILGIYDFCPDYMIQRGFSDKKLLKKWEIGYDQESARVTIPVRDAGGKLVGISKRATHTDAQNKYLHLNFSKGNFLYGEHLLPSGGPLWVVEGQLDALAIDAMGLGGAVSTMGSRVTARQIDFLATLGRRKAKGTWKPCYKVILAYDQDLAGEAAMTKLGEGLESRGVYCFVAGVPPPHKDPCDLMSFGSPSDVETFQESVVPFTQLGKTYGNQ